MTKVLNRQMSIYKRHNNYFLKQITVAVIIALAAIGLSGCSISDDLNVDLPIESVAVSFGAVVETEAPRSRGASMDFSKLKSESFGVLAYYTDGAVWSTNYRPNFMYNQLVNWNNDRWEYSPIKYWPIVENDKVSFFAYAPYDDQNATTTVYNNGIELSGKSEIGAPTIYFTVNSSIADQVDLLYASEIDKNREKVSFNFKHALSRIGFSAKAADDYGDTVIKMTSVSLKGKFYQSGKLNLLDGAWSEYETPAADVRYEHLFEPAKELDTVVELIHGEDGYMMIIPQNFEGSNIFTLEATYTIDEELQPKITEEINLNFEKGKAYNITLNISVDPDESATSVTVLPWVDVNAKREYSDFEISTTANWSNPNLEVSYEMGETIIFNFTMLHPVGRVWKATITNGLDFALDETFAVSGSSGGNPQVGVKALKPVTTVDRTTEFYLTVDGKEVDTNGDGTIGKGHRYVITQKAIE